MAEPRRALSRGAASLSEHAASPWAPLLVVTVFGAWLAAGWALGFPRPWMEALNAAGWFVALVMLFLLQHVQRKDTLAIQLKLNELVRAVEGARDHIAEVEDLDQQDLLELREREQAQRRGQGPPPARPPR